MKAVSVALFLVVSQQLSTTYAFYQRRASKLEAEAHAEAASTESVGLGTALKSQMSLGLSSAASLRRMEQLMDNMTLEDAIKILGETSAGAPLALGLTVKKGKLVIKAKNHEKGMNVRSRGHKHQDSGYGAVKGVVTMLNNMTDEGAKKLDMENVRCADFEKNQLQAIEGTRQDIGTFDAQAAKARADVLGASTEITLIGGKVPKLKTSLGEHKGICTRQLLNGEAQLALVESDVRIMTKVVKMSKCDQNLFLLQCQKQSQSLLTSKARMKRRKRRLSLVSLATSESSSESGSLSEILEGIRSPYARRLLHEELRVMYQQTKTSESPAPMSLLQRTTNLEVQPAAPVKATDDPSKKKAQAKCSIKSNPNCKHMRDKFLQILTNIWDKEDSMKRALSKVRAQCDTSTSNLDAQIDDGESRLKEQQASLAVATKGLNEAGGQSRLKQTELSGLATDYLKTMAVCKSNQKKYESEICGLKKIRAEVLKMEGVNVFIVDCQMSAWSPGECSASCGGGTLKLTRTITQFPDGGAPCQPKEMVQKCNEQPCPVNCKMKVWTGWSSCSAKCGGGVRTRNRGIEVDAKNGGTPCEETSETESCNVQSCDKDCVLTKWSKWSKCSKVCGGGLVHRTKGVKQKAVGNGKCPKPNDKKIRIEYKKCNDFPCPTPPKKIGVSKCDAKLDVIVLLDGSGSMDADGWKSATKAASQLVSAFDTSEDGEEEKPGGSRVALLLYSGPRDYEDLQLCTEGPKNGQKPPDLIKDCGMKWVSESDDKSNHFTTDIAGLAKDVKRLKWPASTSMTSAALLQASDELKFGRKDAQSVVIVITDGKPMSPLKTFEASKNIRKKARLMWIPVTAYAPVKDIKHWSSKPVSENMIQVKDFKTFELPATINTIVTTFCPKVELPAGYLEEVKANATLAR